LNIYGDTTLFQSFWHIADGSCECSMHIAPRGGCGGTAGAPSIMGEAHIAAVWLRRWQIVGGNNHRDKVQPMAHQPGAAGDSVHTLLQVEQCSNLRVCQDSFPELGPEHWSSSRNLVLAHFGIQSASVLPLDLFIPLVVHVSLSIPCHLMYPPLPPLMSPVRCQSLVPDILLV
jgi:hypothetical protein